MKTHTIMNTLLALFVIGAWLYIASGFDLEREAETVRTSKGYEARKAQAALAACGPGASSEWISDSSVACRPHNGAGKAVAVAVAL